MFYLNCYDLQIKYVSYLNKNIKIDFYEYAYIVKYLNSYILPIVIKRSCRYLFSLNLSFKNQKWELLFIKYCLV